MNIKGVIIWAMVLFLLLPVCVLGIGIMVIGALFTLCGYILINICSFIAKILDRSAP